MENFFDFTTEDQRKSYKQGDCRAFINPNIPQTSLNRKANEKKKRQMKNNAVSVVSKTMDQNIDGFVWT